LEEGAAPFKAPLSSTSTSDSTDVTEDFTVVCAA
jgi:hypothetical protein